MAINGGRVDLAWMTIRTLMAFGLATEVILPARTLSASYK